MPSVKPPEAITGQRLREEMGLAEQAAFLNSVLESSTEYSIVAKDLAGRILAWNEGARRVYGYEPADVVGKSAFLLHDPDDVKSGRAQQFLDEAQQSGTWSGALTRVRKDGSRFRAFVTITLRCDAAGHPSGFTMISRDLTESERIERELRESQKELRDKNEQLVEQNQRVQESNRLKSEFLANMSHELRTPLNAIIGFAELMHDGKVGPVSSNHKEYLGDILTSSRHLLQLINDVLDLAKVESGKMEFWPEPVDLEKLVGEVEDVLRTLAAQKRLKIENDIDPALGDITADASKLKQVLYNYLSNALKFSADEGRITVRVKPENVDEFRIDVEDRGIGIKPADMSRLFVEFQQLDASTAKKHAGTGLGLVLTKRIVEAQGGRVDVRSTPGEGSVFSAVLPRGATFTPGPVAEPAAGRAGAPRILVVEDNKKDRTWIVQTLADSGYSVEAVATGAEALARCRQQPYDAVTLDLLLPDMHGRDVIRDIRAEGPNRTTPVVIVTVVTDKGLAAGFHVHDVLIKPVQAEDLLGSLARANVAPSETRPILVVDDDPHARKLAERALEDSGYHTRCVASAEEGLEVAVETPPAAVVLDLLMPGMDGFEFLKRFRATAVGRRTPVIVWTVKDLTRKEREELRAATQGFVLKGEGPASLLAELLDLVPLPPVPTPVSESLRGR